MSCFQLNLVEILVFDERGNLYSKVFPKRTVCTPQGLKSNEQASKEHLTQKESEAEAHLKTIGDLEREISSAKSSVDKIQKQFKTRLMDAEEHEQSLKDDFSLMTNRLSKSLEIANRSNEKHCKARSILLGIRVYKQGSKMRGMCMLGYGDYCSGVHEIPWCFTFQVIQT